MSTRNRLKTGIHVREMFRGYYQPTQGEIEEIWKRGLIALDANVLLSLYNVQPSTSRLYLDAMEKRKSQMWIPHQVALEFHRNVHKERSRQTTAHQNRIKQIDGVIGDLRSTAKKSRLTTSDAQQQAIDSLQALKEVLTAERDTIAEQTSFRTTDGLLERISGLFEGRVGTEPQNETLELMFKDAERRFADEVPPGFEDAKTKTGNRKYGDYVLWRQLMDHAAAEKRDVIFVTDDDKADWWLKIEKLSVAPRPELVQEFRSETGQDILILNSSQFYFQLVPDTTSDQTEESIVAAREDMNEAVTEARTESYYDRFGHRWVTGEEDFQEPRHSDRRFVIADSIGKGIRDGRRFDDDHLSVHREMMRRRAIEEARVDSAATARRVEAERMQLLNHLESRYDELSDLEGLLSVHLYADGTFSDVDPEHQQLLRERHAAVSSEIALLRKAMASGDSEG